MDEAAQIAHDALFTNKGECCFSGTRTFVHEDIYDAFVAKSKELAMKRVVGDPYDSRTTQGPQVLQCYSNMPIHSFCNFMQW